MAGASEQDVTIDELREEVRIVHSRLDNNPDVKRYAGMDLCLPFIADSGPDLLQISTIGTFDSSA